MSCEGWEITKLGNVIELKRGYDLPSQNRVEGSIPIVSSSGISGFHNEAKANAPGVVTGRYGTIGNVYFIDKPFWPLNTTLYVKDYKFNDPKFISYMLRTVNFLEFSDKAAVPGINRNHLHEAIVSIPPLPEQRSIARILSSLDDKIELNNRMNKTLEEMAQTIFKRWFVDFEFPDENGNPYKSSGGKMVESELGMIPEGWGVGTVEALGTIVGGGTPSKTREDFYCNSGIAWITPKDLSNCSDKYISHGATDITHEGYRNSSAKIMPPGTVLFSSRAPIGYLAIALSEISTNQGFKSIVPNKGYGSEFVYYLMKYITPEIENQATGSTFKEVSGGELKSYKIILPNLTIAETFSILIGSSGKQRQKNEQESQILTQLRDVLLPKLMSGEIRVPVTEDKLDD